MTFLAILKDSLREAVDTKVFYVMIGLSAFVTLLAATLSFKPQPPDKIMPLLILPLVTEENDFSPDNFLKILLHPDRKAYRMVSAEPLDDAPEGPDSPYLITLGFQAKSAEEAARIRQNPDEYLTRIREKFGTFKEIDRETRKAVDEFVILKVREARLARPGNPAVQDKAEGAEVFFETVTDPTPVLRRYWPHQPSLFFGALPLTFLKDVPLGFQLYTVLDTVINGLGAWISILLSIVVTAFFIPNMLRKGTVDMLLVKPLRRTTLLLYKYVGGLLFIFLNTTVAVTGVWLALGLRSGLWPTSFLLSILVITFFFAILYAASTLFGVLTRSPIAAILLTCGVWFVIWITGTLFAVGEAFRKEEEKAARAEVQAQGGEKKEQPPADPEPGRRRRRGPDEELPFRSDNWFFTGVRGVHYVLPRAKDLDILMSRLLAQDLLTANQVKVQKIDSTRVSWAESLTVSGLFIALTLGLACLRFATRDY